MANKVILVGNVGADPEVRALETGVKVARIRLATTERIFNRQTNEATDHTEWHNITLWRGLADVADKYVRKGTQLYIEGRLRNREWEKDGVRHFGYEVVADEMTLLGRRSDNPASQQTPYQQPAYQQPAQPQYQQPAQPQYQQPAPQPAQPTIPAQDPDDLPF